MSEWPPELANLPYWELMGRRVRAVAASSPAAREALADIACAQAQPEIALDIVHDGIEERAARAKAGAE